MLSLAAGVCLLSSGTRDSSCDTKDLRSFEGRLRDEDLSGTSGFGVDGCFGSEAFTGIGVSGLFGKGTRSVLCIRITGETLFADIACSINGDAMGFCAQSLEESRNMNFSSCAGLFQSVEGTRRLEVSCCTGL